MRGKSQSEGWVGRAAAVSALLVGGLVLVTPADACMNGVQHEVDNSVQLIAGAEQAVEQGHHLSAMQRVLQARPTIMQLPLGRSPLTDRAARVMARSIVRTDGGLTIGLFESQTAKQKNDNKAWALHVLRFARNQNKEDAGAQTDLGEALAAIPEKRGEALEMLEDLEKRDVISTAYGYAALASLRRTPPKDGPAWLHAALETVDYAPAIMSTARCRAMAKDDAICGPAGATKAKDAEPKADAPAAKPGIGT